MARQSAGEEFLNETYYRNLSAYCEERRRARTDAANKKFEQVKLAAKNQMGRNMDNPAERARIVQMVNDAEAERDSEVRAAQDLKQYEKEYNYDVAKAYDQVQDERAKRAKNNTNGSNTGNSDNTSTTSTTGNNQTPKPENKPNKPQDAIGSGNTGNQMKDMLAGLSRYFAEKEPGGRAHAPNEDNLREQANMHDKQAGDEQKNAQANFQVANRDYRVEAEKNAASLAASKNAQKVANMGNASAGAAALERGVEDADYNTHMQRQDAQRAEAVKNQREMWGSRQTAEEERANANKEAHDYADMRFYNNLSDYLSKGGAKNNTGNPDTGNTGTTNNNPVPKPESTPNKPETTVDSGNPHHVLNYVTFSKADPARFQRVMRGQTFTEGDKQLWQKYGSPPPITKEELQNNGDAEAAVKMGNDGDNRYAAFASGGAYWQDMSHNDDRKEIKDANGNVIGHENARSSADLNRYDANKQEIKN